MHRLQSMSVADHATAADVVSAPSLFAEKVFPSCLDTFKGSRSLLRYFETIGRNFSAANEGHLVNVGARWTANEYDHDVSWDVALARPVRIVAFEADSTNFLVLQHRVARHLPRTSRAVLLNERAASSTIASRLAAHSVPVAFDLLKIDIDSIDLAVAEAILRGRFRPVFIVAEYNAYTPWPLRFAALEATDRERARYGAAWAGPRYQGQYSGSNSIWPCMGASLAMWVAWGRRHDYDLLTTDKMSNVVLVDGSARRRHFAATSTSALACGHAVATFRHNRLRLNAVALLSPLDLGLGLSGIDGHCTRSETPYIAQIDDQCCPDYPAQNSSISMRDKRGRVGHAVQIQRLGALCRCDIME
jgi:hypothetical protein